MERVGVFTERGVEAIVDRKTVALREFTVRVQGLRGPADGLRIAHVSDFHFRRWNRVLDESQHHLMDLDYDLLVATGDFCVRPQQWARAAEMCRRFFDPLRPELGTYAVLGNHDDWILGQQPDLPFTVLHNEHVRLSVNGSCLVLAGVEQHVGSRGDISAALAGAPASAPAIMLAHYPSTVYQVPEDRVRLVLSGHTHGGQVRLPVLGCIWTNDRIPVSLARGLHRVGGTMLHVSAGIGVSAPIWMRYRCPPEVSIITLECVEKHSGGNYEPTANASEFRQAGGLTVGV